MLFHTLDFFLFFALLYAVWRVLPPGRRPWLLLAGSLCFYAWWKPAALLLLLGAAGATHFCALRIAPVRRGRGLWLAGGVAGNLGLLAFFKFGGAFADLFAPGPGAAGVDLLLPIGISFYTFQLTAYLADVYRGRFVPARRFGDLLLFASYFPQLISGPIERARRLLPRLRAGRAPGRRRSLNGLKLFYWGLFKKLYVADNLAPLTNTLLAPEYRPVPGETSLAAVVFALQLYADFSAYVDMARGCSRMLGVELSANFRRPFLAVSPLEFWRRWHVTLHSFLRDYLYRPLGGNRAGPAHTALHVMIVFLVGGVWHGAGWPFALWGLYCGAIVVLSLLLRGPLARACAAAPALATVLRPLGIALTFLTFAHGLLLFHVQSVDHGLALLQALTLRPDPAAFETWRLARIAFYIWPLFAVETILARPGGPFVFERLPAWIQGLVLGAGAGLLTLFGSFGAREFYYFQF